MKLKTRGRQTVIGRKCSLQTTTSTRCSLTSLALSRHRPTTAPPLPGNFTAEPNYKKQQKYMLALRDKHRCSITQALILAAKGTSQNRPASPAEPSWDSQGPDSLQCRQSCRTCVTLAVTVTVIWALPDIETHCLPPQLKVLVHQLC